MYNKTILLSCILLLIALTLSFTWPMNDVRITSSFGESRGDHFHSGIDIISWNAAIYPVLEGELVYYWDNMLFPTENYPGGGNYKILKHDSGYYSIYMHLSDNLSGKNTYSKNDSIGKMGDTGHSSGNHLHLSLFQINTKKYINPLNFLPKTEDKIKPSIEDIFIRIEDKYFLIKNNDNIRLTQHYPLLVNIWDSMHKGERLGIYKISIMLNGVKIMDNNYSEIIFLKDIMSISGKSFNDLYDEKGYYKAKNVKYNDGVNTLSITASDYSGNESFKTISFTVNLETQ